MTEQQWAQWKVDNATVRLAKLEVAMDEAKDDARRDLVAKKIAAEETIIAEQSAELARLAAEEQARFDEQVAATLRRLGVTK